MFRHALHPLAYLLLLSSSVGTVAGAEPAGEKLYKTQCARCHGPQGEGTKRYQKRLEGERSIAQLATQIQKTMPEDDPGTLTLKESQALAAYVHDTFYSRLARERNRPARIELARLTVRQYRQSVSDLVGSFRWQPRPGSERGLKAEYFKNRRYRPSDRVLQRIDPQVAFDFGTDTPVPGKTEHQEFSIRWNGSVMPEVTGEYEILVRTEHAARLWLNNTKVPLIDAWVKSGNDTEYRARIYLVAGRMYPVRLEYSKAKQGVDDSKKNKGKPAPRVKSSITLAWKAPGHALEPIAARHFTTAPSPESYVCSTPFPPDDRSYGWERGTTVSKEWDNATTDAALETAGYIAARLSELSGIRDGDPARLKKVTEFAYKLAERAFRGPLTAPQKAIIDRQFTAANNPEIAIKRVVIYVLKSPRFLYREVNDHPNEYEIASRLSFGLWDSIPDQTLLTAAASGQLKTKEQIAKQAERMLTDLRARGKIRDFLLTWLKADHGLDLAKDPKKFPGFDTTTISDMRTSLERFLDEVVWSDASDFRQLLLSDEIFVNDRLAKFYGVKDVSTKDYRKVKLDADQRAGVLTHPYLMTSFSHATESSPIHRGVFLARGVLGVALRTPPEAVAPLAPDLHPGLTTRERVIMQTKPATCMTCHTVINSLGFSLEHFDAVGRFREKDNNKPIDSTGSYQTRAGKVVQVKGARELAKFLIDSPEVHGAFVEQMFHHLVQQSVRAYGPDSLEELRKTFVADKFHIRKLAVAILVKAATQPRTKTDVSATRR